MAAARYSVCVIALTFMTGVLTANAQDYPNKPIHIVTTTAGGGGDFTVRLITPGMSVPLGQPVVVDNRLTLVAAEAVAKAPPDGYTILIAGASVWLNELLRKVPYDTVNDFAPITLLTREVQVVVVHPSLPVKSVKDLIALAKAQPGVLNASSPGTGTTQHLGIELFKSMAGVNIVHVPYKGTSPSITAVMSGEVHMTIFDAGVVNPHIKSGKLKALAVTSAEPSALIPGLPTVASSGLPGYEWVGMTGAWAPAKTSPAIVNRLNQEIVRVLRLPDIKEKFLNAGVETVGDSPAQFGTTVKTEISKMGKVIKDANIKVE